MRVLARALVLLWGALLWPTPSPAQNATLEVTQQTLNGLLGRLGSLADAGVYQATAAPALGTGQNCQPFGSLDCPAVPGGSNATVPLLVCPQAGGGLALVPGGPAVPWQWRVTDARFTLAQGSMTFTAAVNTRVGDQTNTDTRTVPVSVTFDAASNRLRAGIGSFTVPLQFQGVTIAQVDVAKLYSISLSVEPQEFSVPLPDGGTRTVIARAASVTPQYLAEKLQVAVDVAFTPPPAAPQQVVHLARVGALAPRVDWGRLIPTGRSILRVYESSFNELAERIEPLRWSGTYKFRVCVVDNPLNGCSVFATICDSNYTARVTNLRFDIKPERIRITGNVNAQWCGVSFNANLETTASVTYSSTQDAVLVTVNPTNIQPVLSVAGYNVPLPIHMNVAPSLTLPPVPISTGLFHFETAGGPIALRLSPSHISLTRRDGYLELRAHVSLW